MKTQKQKNKTNKQNWLFLGKILAFIKNVPQNVDQQLISYEMVYKIIIFDKIRILSSFAPFVTQNLSKLEFSQCEYLGSLQKLRVWVIINRKKSTEKC